MKMKERIINKTLHWIIRHDRAYYFCKGIMNIRRVKISELRKPSTLIIKNHGENNVGKIIYYIDLDGGGFFASFLKVLHAMYFADKYGMIPVVDGSMFPYSEHKAVNGSENPWEYYFKQDISTREAEHSFAVVKNALPYNFSAAEFGLKENGRYQINDKMKAAYADIVRKYISLNEICKDFIEDGIKKIICNKKTIGVHIRMGSMMIGVNGHTKVTMPEEYAEILDKVLDKYGFEQIFLASDDKRALDYMKNRYGEMLVYYDDITRVEGMLSIYDMDDGTDNFRYRCGLEVLRDMYTLTSCDGFIGGGSSVSIVTSIVKRSKGERFEYEKLLIKEIHHNKINFMDADKIVKAEKERLGIKENTNI